MKRLQLFGANRSEGSWHFFSERQDKRGRSLENESDISEYPQNHLMNLPPNVLHEILGNLDVADLLNLCVVNSHLYEVISDKFLYQKVVLKSKLSLLKFNALVHSESHTLDPLKNHHRKKSAGQNVRFLIRCIEFRDPIYQDSLLKYSKFYNNDNISTIGGTFSFSAPSFSDSSRAYGSTPISRENTGGSASSASGGFDNLDNVSLMGNTKTQQISSGGWFGTKSNSRRKMEHANVVVAKAEAKYVDYTYIELMLDIIDFCPNLIHVILSDVQLGFKIPLWYSSLNDGSRDFYKKIIKGQQSMTRADLKCFQFSSEWINKYQEDFYALPRLKIMEIKARKGDKALPLRPNMLCCFGVFDELRLSNMIIDRESLDTPLEYLPLLMKRNMEGFLDVSLPIRSLSLDGCEIVPSSGIMKLICSYFNIVKILQLLKIKSKFDLLLSNCFPSLSDLTIDCHSKCFEEQRLVDEEYYWEETALEQDDNTSIARTLIEHEVTKVLAAPPPTTPIISTMNSGSILRVNASNGKKPGMITHSQCNYFNSMNIPKFHYLFHYSKSVWDKLPFCNINLKIVNVPFTNVFPLPPQSFCGDLLDYEGDDQRTLCGNVTTSGEGDFEKIYWWDSVVQDHLRDLSAPFIDEDMESEGSNIFESALVNNFENPLLFKDIPNVNVWYFLQSLSKFKSVEITMLRKWLFCTPRSRYDWELLLKPILNGKIPVKVRDNGGLTLYKYGAA
ncbi:LAMI_0G07008g1_1 [Lachancea mirantina]|uniref:LAMI_0G07008g1_1 n=1 Tax=Lachancea mirantina TaxID=1230905 RepID=A0A1G4K9G6_9SACH|nr:LAMI_0G07008g1_1 [Lachancea mirantina]